MGMGITAQTINLQFNQRMSFMLDISKMGSKLTRFPHLLMLEQWQTENLLIDFLNQRGHRVENKTPLLSFSSENGIVTSKVLTPDGSIEQVRSTFLIGADGSKSLVRKHLNIPFTGKTQQSRLFITDCEARLPIVIREVSFLFGSDYTSGLFPLPGNRWRVDGHIPIIQNKAVAFEDVRHFFGSKLNWKIELVHPQWFSVFRSHSRCADLFRKDRCFLIGDAAHVHSPVGAQGMNTGLQDAHNLAWKLALYLKGKASENILDTYQKERRPLAQSIIRYTDWAYSLMTSNSFPLRFLRLKLLPWMLPQLLSWFRNNYKLRNSIFTSISGIGIKYRNSLLSGSSFGNFPDRAPRPGDRFPYLFSNMNSTLFTLYDDTVCTTFHLFIFGDKMPLPFQTIIDQYREVISVIYIAKEEGIIPIFESLGLKNSGCYLIRPDHYIAWRSRELNAASFGNYLQQFLK